MKTKQHDHQSDEDCFDGSCGPNPFKSQHTPTPWRECQFDILAGDQVLAIVGTPESGSPLPWRESKANAAFIVRAVNSHADLLKALDKSAKSIEQLCAMVNSYSIKLGLGKKVNAHDWIDLAMGRAIAKAEQV